MANSKINKSCRHKKKYPSEGSALGRAGHLNSKGIRVKPYLCACCKGWHLCKRDKVSVLTELFSIIDKERNFKKASA